MEHLEWSCSLGTTKARVIKAVPRRGDSHSIPLGLQPGVSITFFSKASHSWKRTISRQEYSKNGKISGGCGRNYRLCDLGSVHVTSNRDQHNLAFK